MFNYQSDPLHQFKRILNESTHELLRNAFDHVAVVHPLPVILESTFDPQHRLVPVIGQKVIEAAIKGKILGYSILQTGGYLQQS